MEQRTFSEIGKNIKTVPFISKTTKRLCRLAEKKPTKKSIVSSYNVAAVIDDDDYGNPESAFLEKTGQRPKGGPNEAMIYGVEMEPIVAQIFADEYDQMLFKVPIVYSEESDRLCAFVDRVTAYGYNVEIKCPFKKKVYPRTKVEHVKKYMRNYYHQMQLQMALLDLDHTWFVQYGGPPNPNHELQPVISVVDIPRDPLWYPTHKDVIFAFIKRVETYQEEHPVSAPEEEKKE
jgi:hypothetical protein